MRLEELLRRTAAQSPSATALIEPSGAAIAYRGLDLYSEAIAEQLAARGVGEGDRVGLCLPKTIAAAASAFGAMKAGGAYVPVDYSAPAARNGWIFSDCAVRAAVASKGLADALVDVMPRARWRREPLAGGAPSAGLVLLSEEDAAPRALTRPSDPDSLSYILYTSGSTGKPKGVMHSHRTARAFIDWCSAEFEPRPDDVFSSHAPFHFDLSIFDLYVPIKHGAAAVLFDSIVGKQPQAIAETADAHKITVWYSTPSILRMLVDAGVVERAFASARLVLFAGEVYAPKHLARLVKALPRAAFYNLYGPTETNVCTYFRAPGDFDESHPPLPIGFPCSGDRARLVDAAGRDAPKGEEGELLIAGGSVMLGYWNLPDRNREAFIGDETGMWYRTGDIVRAREDGALLFIGRRDRMVKRRGYRVELGEIEAALLRHSSVREAAAVAVAAEDEIVIKAFVAWSGDGAPSLLAMKKHCAQTVPLYMVPDQFVFLDALPKTSTDKIDYQKLRGV
jgi:amino acid adenylation domain-containing protein